jgi:endonuclease/exonuclease/phosphatase family metal-dependent hydrolase
MTKIAPHELTLATYNIHKGLSPLNQRLVIHEVRDKLHAIDADILFLQEVQGAHTRLQHRFHDWPHVSQHEHIAEGRYTDIVYGRNVEHQHGNHGNAILSAYPVKAWRNHDVSHHRFESRGHLLATITVPWLNAPLTCVCVHLGLLHRSRLVQVQQLIDFLQASTAAGSPLIIAGDFNDWRSRHSRISERLIDALGVVEAFEDMHGLPARTFPSILPVFTLDRIYVRGFHVKEATRLPAMPAHISAHAGKRWRRLSDHMALAVTLQVDESWVAR